MTVLTRTTVYGASVLPIWGRIGYPEPIRTLSLEAWAQEIARRAEAVRRGALRGEDWRPVLEEIERELLSR